MFLEIRIYILGVVSIYLVKFNPHWLSVVVVFVWGGGQSVYILGVKPNYLKLSAVFGVYVYALLRVRSSVCVCVCVFKLVLIVLCLPECVGGRDNT